MEQPIRPQARAAPKPGKLNYACEACRISKIKCQSGPQPGICKRYGATTSGSLPSVISPPLPICICDPAGTNQ
ncbi:hypothetical protein GGS23DRAFT_549219 [Durotheca rogersii]|uniref:uncharacterized protein n=1 Tax=Durotheca rogersii TaxID=419775 RepID=UPI00221F6859|nr:uncharacterized protein GGS23DRAFT_549219 [Durotheca rogersii]KAI5867623.1 hypothetical protein GGS23DRAFT_549219 [Durotheca rogersii]